MTWQGHVCPTLSCWPAGGTTPWSSAICASKVGGPGRLQTERNAMISCGRRIPSRALRSKYTAIEAKSKASLDGCLSSAHKVPHASSSRLWRTREDELPGRLCLAAKQLFRHCGTCGSVTSSPGDWPHRSYPPHSLAWLALASAWQRSEVCQASVTDT